MTSLFQLRTTLRAATKEREASGFIMAPNLTNTELTTLLDALDAVDVIAARRPTSFQMPECTCQMCALLVEALQTLEYVPKENHDSSSA